ncbi:MAG: ParB/RepB/Spo0J family partition protein [Roseiflexaceae bacterium]|nr:ParB/RepB/Spo0J family partition protein [Roseiflexaceae bacterium]
MTKRASLRDRSPMPATAPRATDTTLMGEERTRQEVVELRISEIMPNRKQPRTNFDADSLAELAASIREHGVIQPIIVRAVPLTAYEGKGRRYELVAGERRWRASDKAGMTTIPALVRADDTDDVAMVELAIIENLQREDLHPLDEAMALGRLRTDLGYSYTEIADRIGKSKGYVQNRLRLLQLPEDLQQLIAERPDTIRHVADIARIEDANRRASLIAAVRDQGLSRTQTRERVESLLKPTAPLPEAEGYKQSYSQEYDGDNNHKEQPGAQLQKSYVQTYDSDNNHKQPRDATERGQLNGRERATLSGIAVRISGWVEDPSQLSTEDWAALEPLARRLGDLMKALYQKK